MSEICQRYKNQFHFATLYDTSNRIPVYSAYQLDRRTCATQPDRLGTWFVEPQLYSTGEGKDMTTAGSRTNDYKTVQAINADYPNTDYDRGHLNPNFYQCGDSRTATFTLTNAVPQDPCFNQQQWKKMEEKAKKLMEGLCAFPGAQQFFVTGAVPGSEKIPSSTHDEEGDRTREYDRVTVPTDMWTAACCDSSQAVQPGDQAKGFSFAYHGENVPDPKVEATTVSALEEYLQEKYFTQYVNIFFGGCYGNTENTKVAVETMNIPSITRLARTLKDLAISDQSSVGSRKRRFIQDVELSIVRNSDIALKDWSLADVDYGMQLLRTDVKNTRRLLHYSTPMTLLLANPGLQHSVGRTKRSSSAVSAASDEYKVVLDLAHAGDISAQGHRCRYDHPCGRYGESYSWCYTDWKSNWNYCCESDCSPSGYNYNWCRSGSKTPDCSPRSSMVTISGKRCRAGHECATYGSSYYWCYIDQAGNYESCCQPEHGCLGHGYDYKWCYTGKNIHKTWEYCNY